MLRQHAKLPVRFPKSWLIVGRKSILITISVPDTAAKYPGCNFNGPFELPLQAKMSIQFGVVVAVALVRGTIEEANSMEKT